MLKLIVTIYFQLSPYKVCFLGVIDLGPPKPSFHQTFHQQTIISWAYVKSVFILYTFVHLWVINEDQWIKYSMREIDQEEKLSI